MNSLRKLWKILQAKAGWHANDLAISHPWILNLLRIPMTVVDGFGTPGDTLLTGIICHELRRYYPHLPIHCETPNPTLLENHPGIDRLNGPKTFFTIHFWYYDLIARRNGTTNLLRPTFEKLGIRNYNYQARIYLTDEEVAEAESHLASLALPRPLVTINVMSREKTKIWPEAQWRQLVEKLRQLATVIQLGGADEPHFEGVTRLAGSLSMRQSAAILAHAELHVGGVSFLMHVARGVDVPAVIIYGGRETPENSGYSLNENLYRKTECSPCWLHESRGDHCPYDIGCMNLVTPEQVMEAIKRKLPTESQIPSR